MAKSARKSTGRRSAKERRKEQTAGAIQARVRQERRRRGLNQQVERFADDAEALAKEVEKAEAEGASGQRRRGLEQRRGKLQKRWLRLLERDDEFVREALVRREKLTAIMAADQPTDADEMMWYLAEVLKLLGVFEALAPPPTYIDKKTGKEVKRRTNYPPVVLNLLSILSRYLGLSNKPDIEAVVLADIRWMSVLGFNAQEVEQGACRRSESLCGKTRQGRGGRFVEADEAGPVRARLEGPRGALSSQTLEEHESNLEPEALVAAYNEVVRAMARQGVFGKELRAALDTTAEETVPSFKEAGTVRKKVKVRSKARRPRQVEVSVRGFKIWYVMDVDTGLPLAMVVDTINKSEGEHAQAVVDQARENLKGHSRLVSLAIDRGFLDGDLLWWLKKKRRIDWVCPGKEGMQVTTEARQRVAKALEVLQQPGEQALDTARRAARSGLSAEGVKFFERQVKPGRETLVVAEVDDLVCTDFYGPGGSGSSRVNSKKFRPTPLFATVVLNWPDRSADDLKDAQEHDDEEQGPVVLLSPLAEPALARFDRYDERSLIENRLNRDGKQYFGLGGSLARSTNAVWSANVFSTIALMLHRGLEIHREQMAEEFDRRSERLGVLRYRRQQMIKNRNRIIVVVKDRYGFLRLDEFARLLGAEFL